MKTKSDRLIPLAVIVVLLILWQIMVSVELVPSYLLPSPLQVLSAFVNDFPLLMKHSSVTLLEAFLGLILGVSLGFLSAALMDAFPIAKKGLYPILVLTQTIPPVAIAPLLILWFSYGITPKVVLVVLVSFFPMAVGLLQGFESVDPDMIKLMKSMGADKKQIFFHVKVPAALPEFFSGLRVAVAYSVVGAVIAEWLGGFTGLGVYMTRVKKSLSYDKMFAVIFLISAISLLMMALVGLLERKIMVWEYINKEEN